MDDIEDREIVVLVDDDISNLKIGRNALIKNYDVYTALSAKLMFEMLEQYRPQIILLDVSMPEMDGYEAIKILKDNPETRDIPVIFLTGKSDHESELEGLKLGAVDYITKPFFSELLNRRVELHLRTMRHQQLLKEKDEELRLLNEDTQRILGQRTKEVFELQLSVLRIADEILKRRGDHTVRHSSNIQTYLRAFIEKLSDSDSYSDQIRWNHELVVFSSSLHDVGTISLPELLLYEPYKLTDDEFELVKAHPLHGAEIIDAMIAATQTGDEFLGYARIFAKTHHERWDGSGYPDGLKGEEIPFLGRVMAIIDVYDALVSERPYRKAYTSKEALEIIQSESGTSFEPGLVEVFAEAANEF
ncbi:two-component system response regulator [Clostridia bacterium]|nr:two-component system response regulator [Clostridia bacterium]GHU77566.1 two-component system response regulator [Clostridia bacterium]